MLRTRAAFASQGARARGMSPKLQQAVPLGMERNNMHKALAKKTYKT